MAIGAAASAAAEPVCHETATIWTLFVSIGISVLATFYGYACGPVDTMVTSVLLCLTAGIAYTGFISMVGHCNGFAVQNEGAVHAACETIVLPLAALMGISAQSLPMAQSHRLQAGFLIFVGSSMGVIGRLAAALQKQDASSPSRLIAPGDCKSIMNCAVRTAVVAAAVGSGGAMPVVAAATFVCALQWMGE